MSLKYEGKFYNHFENQEYKVKFEKKGLKEASYYKKEDNLLLRYRARIPEFVFPKTNLTIRYFKEGSGEYVLNGKRLKVRNDRFLIMNPNDGWEYINENNGYVDILSFAVCDEMASKYNFYVTEKYEQLLDNPFGEEKEESYFMETMLAASHYSTGRLLKSIYDLSNKFDFYFTCPYELTIEILQSLYKEQALGYKMVGEINAKKTSTKLETLKRLLVAYEFIHDNIGKPISIEELATISSLSKFHLYDSFKRAFGKTPHQYINRLKIAKAKNALQNTDASVSEISDSFGFSDPEVFSKVFKKVYGKPPSNYLIAN
ncbi:AraC family transcriptional regulator [Maribacter sp. 2210JD10-5]|uniref:AraC family transcriptional regulator n=1 Tax=Maribacter sp. 2210JD10-5 TaxID=3386272 RepID=UPI0039BC636F